jgi:hypothetical protein
VSPLLVDAFDGEASDDHRLGKLDCRHDSFYDPESVLVEILQLDVDVVVLALLVHHDHAGRIVDTNDELHETRRMPQLLPAFFARQSCPVSLRMALAAAFAAD